ncbi:B lymphocyte-induced maturation protein 1 homolog [Lytechinus variegatus]|uniref:B lymphocyte-induced maturation protein 1 homolog n=1 Tax=Lytechinus variegatus TaxID=7654 RepID=UPI001BB22DEC|nr:B lymphocyte-induced maturation protein 1 homolog [Lytechinus variegatus]
MENNTTPFSCDVCNAEFTLKRNLMRHHRMFHHGQMTLHVCDTCGKALSRPDNLKRHMKTHQGFSSGAEPDQDNKRPTCSQCNALFLEQKDLDEHMKSHRKETYHCHTCGQIYHNRAKLMKHKKSHHNPVPPKLPKKRVADGPVSNQAKRRQQQPNLAPTTVNLPSDIDPESCAAEVYREHWLNIRDRRSFGRVHRFYNYHLPDLSNDILREIAQKVFEEQSTAFKINASYGFILCNNETNECRYYCTSNNTKILNEPVLISDHLSFQRFMDTFLKEDTLEYARTLRPNSKWVVQYVTNVTSMYF